MIQERMTAAEYRALVNKPVSRGNKYGAVPTYRCGSCWGHVEKLSACLACGATNAVRFDSTGEAERWDELKRREKLGLIFMLRRQVPYQITAAGDRVATVILDFVYVCKGALVVEDFKGKDTPVSRLKRKLVEKQHGITVTLVRTPCA